MGNEKTILSKLSRIAFRAVIIILAVTLAVACETTITEESNGDDDGGTQSGRSDYSGIVFKGPFKVGSSVAVLELDADLLQTGNAFHGDIVDDDGAYSIAAAPFAGPVEIVATGSFFDEVANTERGEITLRALTDEDGTVNINVASAIQRDRIRELVNGGSTFETAKETAQKELWQAFEWASFSTDSTKIELDGIDGDRLLALSSIIATTPHGGIRNVSEMSALIVNLRTDFADGAISKTTMTDLRDAAIRVNPQSVQANLDGYFIAMSKTIDVPLPETALNNFVASIPVTTVEYDDDNYIHPALAGAQAGEMGMGRNDGFLIGDGQTMTITVTGDTDYFSVTPRDFTETSPGVYEAAGLGYRELGVSFGNIPTSAEGVPEVESYTITIDVTGADDFTIVYTVEYPS